MSDQHLRELARTAIAPAERAAFIAVWFRAGQRDPRLDPLPGDVLERLERKGLRRARRLRFVVAGRIDGGGFRGWAFRPDEGRHAPWSWWTWDASGWATAFRGATVVRLAEMPPEPCGAPFPHLDLEGCVEACSADLGHDGAHGRFVPPSAVTSGDRPT